MALIGKSSAHTSSGLPMGVLTHPVAFGPSVLKVFVCVSKDIGGGC